MGKKDDLSVKAREVLSNLWESCQLKGRCWGKKNKRQNNIYSGTNITLARGNEIVTICEMGGRLVVHEFKRGKTELGEEVNKLLRQAGLPSINLSEE